MKFVSTRGKQFKNNASEAIVQGLASDGGLFVPEYFPQIWDKLPQLLDMTFAERACFVMHQYLEEYDYQDLLSACQNAYNKFENQDAAPLVKLDEKTFVLELFHGPTLAFKDIALTILPYLLRKGADYCGVKQTILILVATSGDTGKAALEGFKDADGIKIMVFYPSEGVSDMQKLQMQTQEGCNVNVVGVKGNFDDCQTAVKNIFSDNQVHKDLFDKNVVLSSANSINFGRLVPQISYYFSAYCDLVNSNEIKLGDKVDFVVPTGNFGNILAGYYAKKMGLPVGKLVCASNSNNVLTDFFVDGDYDANREFFKTYSPSMDILISSNLERLLFEVSGRKADITAERMSQLKSCGKYSISKDEKTSLDKEFFASCCSEDNCMLTIKKTFNDLGYLCDTHTSVALKVSNDYVDKFGKENPIVVLSTASPYKFTFTVLDALKENAINDPFVAAKELYEMTAMEIPKQILSLKSKNKRFVDVIDKTKTLKAVFDFIEK